MKSWSRPVIPRLPGHGPVPTIWNTASESVVPAQPIDVASLYVCGITPYDATHLGHAATYLAYDTLLRLWLDAGYDVRYVQNSTDVDDPLLERAVALGVDWRDLAARQTEFFRVDMETLGIIPPDHYIAVTERIAEIAGAVEALAAKDIAYRIDNDYYFDSAAASRAVDWHLGDESHYGRALMLELSAQRGGDPERPGKRDPLDPLLWRGPRGSDPSWESVIGSGRPGWHIECSVISSEFLDLPITVSGGGSDLIFPHHEFTAGHTYALTGTPLTSIHSHAGLVAYQGEKMSKSLGNLVFVSDLIDAGTDARAIRLAIQSQHYRSDWEWTDALLTQANERLNRWAAWAQNPVSGASEVVLQKLRDSLVNDLDTPAALDAVDKIIMTGADATTEDVASIDALLGIRLDTRR